MKKRYQYQTILFQILFSMKVDEILFNYSISLVIKYDDTNDYLKHLKHLLTTLEHCTITIQKTAYTT